MNIELEKYIYQWVVDYEVVNKVRVRPVVHVAHNLFKSEESLKYSKIFLMSTLWLFALDDIFDSSSFGIDESRRFTSLLLGGRLKDHDIWKMYADIVKVGGYSTASSKELFCFMKKTVNGMLIEKQVQMNLFNFKSLEQYLEIANFSIGTPFALSSVQLTELSTSCSGDFLVLAGRITRLLNDIRSFDKELEEGLQNSLTILMDQGLDYDNALSCIDDIISRDLEKLKKMCFKLGVKERFWCNRAHKLCYITMNFYKHSDFHLYEKERFI